MTRGRPIAFDTDQAMHAAVQLFWARGYESASTRELLEAMNISRSSLYQAYGNKEGLFLQALQHYRDALVARLQGQLEASPSAMEFLEALFHDTARDAGSERAALGCLIFNSASELGQGSGEPTRQTRESLAAITGVFRRAVERAQNEGDIASQRDVLALATYLTLGMAGLRTLLRSGAQAEEAGQAVDLLLGILRQ